MLRTIPFSVLFRKTQESLTVYSISLIHPIIFQKMRLNSLIILSLRSLVIQNKTFIAMSLIRLSLSVRHRKMQLIIFSSYVRRIFWSFCIADITLDITSNPTIFFIISLLCRYFAENILIICSTISGEYLVAYSYINRSSYTRPYLLFYSFLSN